MSAIRPCKWTGRIAFVRGVIAASIKAGIHRPGDGIDVDEDRLCAAVKHRGCRRDERHRDCDDLIAGTDAGRKQRQVQRRGAAIDRTAMADVAIGRKTLLEGRDLRSQHKLRAFDGARNRGIDFRLDLTVLSFQIQKRYQCPDPCAFGVRPAAPIISAIHLI